ncbi:MAG: acyltransferase family protein [Anaeromyxobacter sp.]
MSTPPVPNERLHALDAVRALALVLGVLFHAGFSFLPGLPPGLWARVDASPSAAIGVLVFASHVFRMTLFFLVAGFFARALFRRRGAAGFWRDRLRRILVPLVAGWLVLFPAVTAVWLWGLRETFGGTLPPPPAGLPPPPPGAFPLTHLWFLYQLLVLYVLVLAARGLALAVAGRLRLDLGALADAAVRRLARTGAAALVLPLPLVAALALREDWVIWFGIPTPDRSLIPELPALAGYGTAVAFGWLVHRQAAHLLEGWARRWPAHLAVAAAATSACLAIAGPSPVLVPAPRGAATAAYAALYGLAAWCWTFALVGLAVRFLSRPSPRLRYLADASYWIYLAHLPLVAALQVLAGPLPLHWSVKFPAIVAVALAVLLLSYRWFVRGTFIGQTLNGRRLPHAPAPAPAAPPATGPEPGGAAPPLAALSAVTKRFGATVALDGLDLEVRPGEVVALLGPNGAGKSTAIGLWLGLLDPDGGQATLGGLPPREAAARRRVGVMMQDVELTPELSVRELVALAASAYPAPLGVADVLSLTRLEPLAARRYGTLSGGQKRLVQFAVAVCGRPALLFLDEPTANLDVEAREALWCTVRAMVERGAGVVLTTHHLEEAEALAHRVAVLSRGRLLATGSVSAVRALVSHRRIRCLTGLAPEAVRGWPGVLAVAAEGPRVLITVTGAEDVLRRLLAEDPGVRDLEVHQAGLAEAFTTLTREAA